MEVASSGDPVGDLVKIGIELAVHSSVPNWWEPLFDGPYVYSKPRYTRAFADLPIC